MALFIFISVIGLILWGIYALVRKGTDRIFEGMGDTSSLPIMETVQKATSISRTYEKMYENPLQYTKTELDTITKKYTDLIAGKIKDPDGYHAPVEYIGTRLNTDYYHYLQNQVKVLPDSEWHKKELKRIERVIDYQLVQMNFGNKLIEMGAPNLYIQYMVNEYRINQYSPQDWENLVKAVKRYSKTSEIGTLVYFLECTNDINILTDPDKLELYTILRNYEVPQEYCKYILERNIEYDTLCEVQSYLSEGYTIQEALDTVLTNNELNKLKQQLQSKMR